MFEVTYIDSIEALSWLESTDGKERDIREDPATMLDLDASLRLVRSLYAAGATQVLALNLVLGDDFEFAQGIQVNLPHDPDKRAAVYAIGVRALREMDTPWDDVTRNGDSFNLRW